MNEYTITRFLDGVMTIAANGKIYRFAVPVINGLYLEGDALTKAIEAFITAEINKAASTPVVPANTEKIMAMVTKPSPSQIASAVRAQRDKLLTVTDWTMIPSAALTPEQSAQWHIYRQVLRNLPTQPGWPTSVHWPVPPIPVVDSDGTTLTTPTGIPVESPKIHW